MREPRTLLYDLEISPMLGWAYEMWDTNILKIEREPYIMSVAWKWAGDNAVSVLALPDFPEAYAQWPHSDFHVVNHLHKLMDEADIVVAHNARKFDNRVATARFLLNHLQPPSPYKTVDTLQAARRFFRFPGNSLVALCGMLDIGDKTEVTHGKLWYKCVNGDMDAWQKMKEYNIRDVELLDELYYKLRPYISNHPNIALLVDKLDGCPRCGSDKLNYRGFQHTATGSYHRVRCQSCGAWSRERLQARDEEDKPLPRPMFVGVN
jgi:hypothetical protein